MQKTAGTIATLILILGLFGTATAQAPGCAAQLGSDPDVSEILDCLRQQEAELQRLTNPAEIATRTNALPLEEVAAKIDLAELAAVLERDYRDRLMGKNGAPGRDATAPSGIVVASTRRCKHLGEEWANYDDAGGRFIIGAGDHGNKWTSQHNGKKHDISAYVAFGEPVRSGKKTAVGGEEEHVLTNPEMPSHSHPQSNNNYYWIGNGNNPQNEVFSKGRYEFTTTTKVSAQGGNQPHNNMPPYIALYFCKKK